MFAMKHRPWASRPTIIRRVLVGGAICVLASIAAFFLLLKYSPEVTLTFTQAQLQSELAPKFPVKKCVLGACLELVAPRITLLEGADRIGIETAFVANLGNRTMPGSTKLTGRPRYDQGSGNFYLQDVQVAEFAMTGNAPDFDEVVKARGPRIVAAIMNNFPLYSVQKHPKYGAIAKLAIRSVRVVNGQLQVDFVNPLLLFGR
jgi:hypothetical protein